MHRIARLSPSRPLLLQIALGCVLALAFSSACAAVLGFHEASAESGPMENIEILLLAGGAVCLLATAFLHRRPGAPGLALLAFIFGLMALREFDAPPGSPFEYFAERPVRVHWGLLVAALTAVLAWRDRRWTPRQHLRGTLPIWAPVLAAALIVVFGSVFEEAAERSDGTPFHEWVEEMLEVGAYAVLAIAARSMWNLRRQPPVQATNDADGITFAPESGYEARP